MSLVPEGNAPLSFSDLPLEEALRWARKMPEHSTPSFREKLTYPGYNDVECHYVVCEGDKIIPPEFQYSMIELLKKSTGRDVGVHKIDAGHIPTVSQPDNLAKIIKNII